MPKSIPIIISRKTAKEKNLKFYTSLNPCKNNHTSKRRVSNGVCIECEKNLQSTENWKKKNYLSVKKYKKTKKGKEKNERFRTSDKGKKLIKKYQESEKGKESFKTRHLKGYIAKYHKKWRESIKGKLYLEKKLSQTHYRLHDTLSSFFRNTLKKTTGTYKKKLTMKELTGLNKKDLVTHIENKWELGMNWSNHTRTGWHIDHIIPVDYFIKNFDYSNIEIQKKCWNFKNLQPLWAKENMKKGNKII